MAVMPMFPLGSVLFPHMPTALRIFEERYIVMLSEVLGEEPAEFGIVLIERGSEVGGGEQRFPIGTVAQIAQVQTAEGFIGLVAQGAGRIEVTDWLPDDPYPKAKVRAVEALEYTDDLDDQFDWTVAAVRQTIARASEFVELQWSADTEIDDDRQIAMWQLAGIAPLGPIDQVALLRSTSAEELLRETQRLTLEAAEMLTVSWDDDEFPTLDS